MALQYRLETSWPAGPRTTLRPVICHAGVCSLTSTLEAASRAPQGAGVFWERHRPSCIQYCPITSDGQFAPELNQLQPSKDAAAIIRECPESEQAWYC